MNFTRISKVLLAGVTLLLVSSAFAGTKASLTLGHSATINGTTLKAGDYKLEWEGTGPNVEVSIIQHKNVVAKVPARLVDMTAPSENDAAVFTRNSDGSNTLTGARFQGRKYGLELGESSDGMQAGSSR